MKDISQCTALVYDHGTSLQRRTFFSLSSIVGLLLISCPTAIFRIIGTIIVDAIKCGSLGTLPHVRKEILERIPPSVANGNATSTVIFVIFTVWVEASVFQPVPRFVSFCLALMVLAGVCSGMENLCAVAAATGGIAISKRISLYFDLIATNAMAGSPIPALLITLGDNSKSPVDMSDYANPCWHTLNYSAGT